MQCKMERIRREITSNRRLRISVYRVKGNDTPPEFKQGSTSLRLAIYCDRPTFWLMDLRLTVWDRCKSRNWGSRPNSGPNRKTTVANNCWFQRSSEPVSLLGALEQVYIVSILRANKLPTASLIFHNLQAKSSNQSPRVENSSNYKQKRHYIIFYGKADEWIEIHRSFKIEEAVEKALLKSERSYNYLQ